jgi:hypothetical protein
MKKVLIGIQDTGANDYNILYTCNTKDEDNEQKNKRHCQKQTEEMKRAQTGSKKLTNSDKDIRKSFRKH